MNIIPTIKVKLMVIVSAGVCFNVVQDKTQPCGQHLLLEGLKRKCSICAQNGNCGEGSQGAYCCSTCSILVDL